ncbi:protein containing Prepilin-type cleavage/methylation, N-terminal domain, partial [sediment metagenome]
MLINNKVKKMKKGFTLLELLVVIALMGIIYTITLSNYAGLNKSVELQNTLYDIALSIRETQVYGINKDWILQNLQIM